MDFSFMYLLTENELKESYDDILEWRKTGVVSEKSIIRIMYKNVIKQLDNENYPFWAMEQMVLSEIARRYYGK